MADGVEGGGNTQARDPRESQVGRTHAEPVPKIKVQETAATVLSSSGGTTPSPPGAGGGTRGPGQAPENRKPDDSQGCEAPGWPDADSQGAEVAADHFPVCHPAAVPRRNQHHPPRFPQSLDREELNISHQEPSKARRASETCSWRRVSESSRSNKVRLSSSNSIPVSLGAMRGCQSEIRGKSARPSISFWAPGGAAARATADTAPHEDAGHCGGVSGGDANSAVAREGGVNAREAVA